MALPRYKPSEVRLQPGAESIAYNAQSTSWNNLSQKLGQFSNLMYGDLAQQREKEAQDQAVIDVAEGKIKDVGDFTIYDKAYSTASRSAFLSKTDQDAKSYAQFVETQIQSNPNTKNNPDAFKNAFDGYMKGVLAEAPDETTRAVVKQSIAKYGINGYNSILKAKTKADEDYQSEAFTSGLNLYTQEYKDAVASKNQKAINIATNKLVSFYQSGYGKYTSPEQAQLDIKTLQKETYKEVTMQEFAEAQNKVSFLKDIREKAPKVIGFEDTDKLIDSMHTYMESEYNDRKLLREKEKQYEDDMKDKTTNNLNTKLLEDNLTKDDLDSALKFGYITKSEYDDYTLRMKTPGFSKDDDDTYTFYLKNLDTTTPEMIFNAPLTKESKKDLLTKLNKNEKDALAEGDFTKMQNYKQGVSEIKNHFQVFEGAIMSRADINNDNMKDYGIIKALYYDTIEAMKPEEMNAKAKETARQILKDYENGDIVGTKKYKDKQEEEASYTQGAITKEEFNKMQKTDGQIKGADVFKQFLPDL